MDEPTSALSPAECQLLFEVIRQLAAAGVAIVYISHRMDEVALLADRITILRDGRLVASAPAPELSEARIISHMVGREVMPTPPARATGRAEIALSVGDLGLRVPLPHGGFKDAIGGVSFELRAGEILGIGGLLGSGRTEILETIFGSASGQCRGEVRVYDQAVVIDGPRDAIRTGIALVTEDRKTTGLLLKTSIRENVALPSQPRLNRLGWRQFVRERTLARDAITRLHIRCRDDLQLAAELSGGNQQKVVIGKWLATRPRILLLDEPTRGIDVGAKEEIYAFIFGMAAQGIAIVVVTSELPELLLLSDRVLVMCEGRQTGILARGEATEEAVMRLAAPRGAAARMNA
jgi:ribose transport system ATP-binding protein